MKAIQKLKAHTRLRILQMNLLKLKKIYNTEENEKTKITNHENNFR